MRNISAAMHQVIDGGLRRPAYKIYAWDPTAVTISEVVCAVGILEDPAPVDLTPYASEVSWSDRQFAFTLVDPQGLFHPDFGTKRHCLRDGAILRLVARNPSGSAKLAGVVRFDPEEINHWLAERKHPARNKFLEKYPDLEPVRG